MWSSDTEIPMYVPPKAKRMVMPATPQEIIKKKENQVKVDLEERVNVKVKEEVKVELEMQNTEKRRKVEEKATMNVACTLEEKQQVLLDLEQEPYGEEESREEKSGEKESGEEPKYMVMQARPQKMIKKTKNQGKVDLEQVKVELKEQIQVEVKEESEEWEEGEEEEQEEEGSEEEISEESSESTYCPHCEMRKRRKRTREAFKAKVERILQALHEEERRTGVKPLRQMVEVYKMKVQMAEMGW